MRCSGMRSLNRLKSVVDAPLTTSLAQTSMAAEIGAEVQLTQSLSGSSEMGQFGALTMVAFRQHVACRRIILNSATALP